MPNSKSRPAPTIDSAQIEAFFRELLTTKDVDAAAAAAGVDTADMMLAMEEGTPENVLYQRHVNAMYNRIELDMLCRAFAGTKARSKEDIAAGGHVIYDDAQALRLLSAHRARQEKRAAEVAKLTGTACAPLPPVSAEALFTFLRERVEAAEAAPNEIEPAQTPKGSRPHPQKPAEARMRGQNTPSPSSTPLRSGEGWGEGGLPSPKEQNPSSKSSLGSCTAKPPYPSPHGRGLCSP